MTVPPSRSGSAETRAEAESRTINSAIKCLALIDALAAEKNPLGVSELARRTNSLRGTVHQQLRTLIAAGWVQQNKTGHYHLTLHAFTVGSSVVEQMDLGSRVLPTLAKLSATTGETASVAVLYEGSALIIQRVAADRALRVDIKPGTKMPLHKSASGRILTANAPAAELKGAESAGVTLPTASTRRADHARGYASQCDDYIVGMASLAVPVHTDAHEMGTIALAIAAPSARYQMSSLLDAVRVAASELASLLNY